MNSWNLVAQKYNNLVGETGDIYHKTYINPVILELLGNIKNKKILDLACGQGYFSRILAQKEARVFGIDNAKELLKIAKKREKEKLLDVKYYLKDASNLRGMKNSFFDIIVINMSFHNIKDVEKTIKECSRVLKRRGRVIFSIPHPWKNMAKNIIGKRKCYLKVEKYKSISCQKHFIEELNVKIYRRPVEFYLQEFFKNNFVISGFFEITTRHYKNKNITNTGLLNYRKEIPSFLIVEATKLN